MVESMTIQEFLDVLSSKEPVPGRRRRFCPGRSPGQCPGTDGGQSDHRQEEYAQVEDEIKGTGREDEGNPETVYRAGRPGCKGICASG